MPLPTEGEAHNIGIADGTPYVGDSEAALRATANVVVRLSTGPQMALEAGGWPQGRIAVYHLTTADLSGYTEVVLDRGLDPRDFHLSGAEHLALLRYDWASDAVEGPTLRAAYATGFADGV